MSRIKIKDNSRIPKESLSGISLLTSKIADKTLEQLENEGVFVFPEILRDADDITKDQMILQSVNNYFVNNRRQDRGKSRLHFYWYLPIPLDCTLIFTN